MGELANNINIGLKLLYLNSCRDSSFENIIY